MLKVPAQIDKFGECGYIAYTDKFNGFVVQSDTHDGVIKEFVTSLIVKMAYDSQLSIESDITKNGEQFEVSLSKLINDNVIKKSETEFELALF